MPTKKRRVGFIPRSDVLEIIDKLSFESNLSNSKIISILVEEALFKRGIFKLAKGNDNNKNNDINIIGRKFMTGEAFKSPPSDINIKSTINKSFDATNENDYSIDPEIYNKFIMFLHFQEKMQKRNA